MWASAMVKWALALLGVAAVAIGGAIYLLGPAATGALASAPLQALGLVDGPPQGLAAPDADSELRFYAVLWIAYGGLAWNTALALPAQIGRARTLLLIFFAGGVGRAFSWFAVGAPHPLFQLLMAVELGLPLIVLAVSFRATPSTGRTPQ